jgi:tetratricopeptide (TPR) repeat protein
MGPQRRASVTEAEHTLGLPHALRRAAAAYGAGKLVEAEQICRQALAVQPNLFEAVHLLALVQAARGDTTAALASYDRALTMRPDAADALSNRGLVLHQLERFEEALASYESALALRPGFAQALFNRGNALQALERHNEALTSYDRALAVRPDYAKALANRGLSLHVLSRHEEALASYDRALAVLPDNAEALASRGLTLQALTRHEEALASYDRALAVRPDYAKALADRGHTLVALKRFAAALASYQRALELRPDDAEVHYGLGVVLVALGRLAEGRAAVERAIALSPRTIKYHLTLVDISPFDPGGAQLTQLKQLADGAGALSVDDRIQLHFALGQAYEAEGRHADAFSQWREGNALKRRQINYDEAATLARLDWVRTAFTPEAIDRWRNSGDPSRLPIFIVGMARSGSTLVEQVLASHPQVFGGGELQDFGEALNEIRLRFDGGDERLAELATEDFRAIGARYLARIRQLAPDAGRITDKMPANFVFAGLIHLALPNATIIHSVRDPLDTCLSCFSKLFREQNHTYDLAELGRYYRYYQAVMAHWHRVLPPGRILDVHYEDLVADLEGQARSIIAHCGLPWDPQCLRFQETERPVLTLSAAQVRQPIYRSAIGRWRAYENALGPLLAELGSPAPAGSGNDGR